MKIKKLISLALSTVLFASLLSSCGKSEETVLTVDTFEVTYDMYRYTVLNAKADVEAEYGDGVWTSDKAEAAEKEAEAAIKDYLAKAATVYSLASEYGIDKNSGSVKADVEGAIAEMIEDYEVEADFYDELEENGMTKEVLRTLTENSILNEEVYTAIVKADKNSDSEDYFEKLFASDELIRVKQILTGGENGGTDEENLEKAEELLARLEAGEDFDRLAQVENCDLFMFQNDDGYYILKGTRDKNFEEAAFSLKIGEMSGIVKTDMGYTIIKRYEKDEEYIENNFDDLISEYEEGVFAAKFEARLDEIKKNMGALPEKYDISEME